MADPSTSKPSSLNDRNIPTVTPHHPPDPPECQDGDNNNHANKKPSALSSKLSVKPSRRVSFSETNTCYEYSPPHKGSMRRCFHQSSKSSSSNRHCGCGIHGCGLRCGRFCWCSSPSSRCCICCMWSCIVLLCLFFMVAVAFALFLIYFQPRLPVFRIERLDFSSFNITTGTSSLSQHKYLLSTDIELSVVASNVNEKIDFSYSPLTVYVSSGNVTLGNGEVPGFFQLATAYSGHSNVSTPTTTTLNVRAGVSQSAVDIEDGERLRTNLLESSNTNNNRKTRTMMTNLDVILSGTIRFNFRSSSAGSSGSSSSSSSAGDETVESEAAAATSKFPVSVLCMNIDMSRVALGYNPHCKVELFTFQVTNTPNVF